MAELAIERATMVAAVTERAATASHKAAEDAELARVRAQWAHTVGPRPPGLEVYVDQSIGAYRPEPKTGQCAAAATAALAKVATAAKEEATADAVALA